MRDNIPTHGERRQCSDVAGKDDPALLRADNETSGGGRHVKMLEKELKIVR